MVNRNGPEFGSHDLGGDTEFPVQAMPFSLPTGYARRAEYDLEDHPRHQSEEQDGEEEFDEGQSPSVGGC